MKLLITNLVYGEMYADIFLNHHLNSFLDESNIPSLSERIEYAIFTDRETQPYLESHPKFKELASYVPVHLKLFDWPERSDLDKFAERYALLVAIFKLSVQMALEKGMWLSPIVADLVCAKSYIPKVLCCMDKGFDSVFVMPMRSALEAMHHPLSAIEGALPAQDLFELAYANLHPLWVASHWNAPQFTKLPYSLVWNTGNSLVVRSFSVTPIVFIPTIEMLSVKSVIDVEIPSMCKKPFWATDWIDCPILGVEPLQCYYPPFKNGPANVEEIKAWAERHLHPSQWGFLSQTLYYPRMLPGVSTSAALVNSDLVVAKILREGK